MELGHEGHKHRKNDKAKEKSLGRAGSHIPRPEKPAPYSFFRIQDHGEFSWASYPDSPWPLLSFLRVPCVASVFTPVLTTHPLCGHPGGTGQGLTSLGRRGKGEESALRSEL